MEPKSVISLILFKKSCIQIITDVPSNFLSENLKLNTVLGTKKEESPANTTEYGKFMIFICVLALVTFSVTASVNATSMVTTS